MKADSKYSLDEQLQVQLFNVKTIQTWVVIFVFCLLCFLLTFSDF